MSLNGLDSAKVADAYQSALSAPGGWFLLHYTSRDEVDLLAKGSGGLPELRAAVASYQESSPIYGFVHYRWRTVLLKYVPEGTSRLLKARTTVHFPAVKDVFVSHDTTFDASTAEDLTDTALSAACSLQAETDIVSPETSLPRDTLGETADGLGNVPSAQPPHSKPVADDEIAKEVEKASTMNETPSHVGSAGQRTPRQYEQRQHSYSSHSKRQNEHLVSPEAASITSRTASATPDLSYPSSTPKVSEDRPHTAQELRPSPSDYVNTLMGWKQKAKLFPRPVEDIKVQRPHPEEPARQKLPSGLRLRQRKGDDMVSKKQKSPRPKRNPDAEVEVKRARSKPLPVAAAEKITNGHAQVPPNPPTPSIASTSIVSPSESTVADLASLSSSQTATGSQARSISSTQPTETLSPEKQRLMKALQMRRAQTRAASGNNTQVLIAAAKKERDEMAKDPVDEPKGDRGGAVDDATDRAPAELTPEQQEMGKALPTTALVAKSDDGTLAPRGNIDDVANRSVEVVESSDSAKVEGTSADISPPAVPTASSFEHESADGKTTQATNGAGTTSAAKLAEGDAEATSRPGKHATRISKIENRKSEAEKRHERVRPIKVDSAGEEDDAGFMSDDSLLEELESATVQEARRVSISLSPVHARTPTPTSTSPVNTFDTRRPSTSVSSIVIRSTSLRGKEPSNSQGGLQESRPQSPTSNGSAGERPTTVRKSKLSTGISKRVHALADLSRKRNKFASLDATAVDSAPPSSFLAFRESSFAHSSEPPTLIESSVTGYRPTSARTDSYTLDRRSSTQSADISGMTENSSIPPHHRGESSTFSITARIVKPASSRPSSSFGRNKRSIELQQSVVTVERRTASRNASPSRPVTVSGDRPMSRGSAFSTKTRPSMDGALRMLGMQSKEPLVPLAPSFSSMTNTNLDPVEENRAEERRQNRTNRFLKRMGIAPSPTRRRQPERGQAGSEALQEGPTLRRPSHILVGDVNVQFPDTLLWKRRMAEIDGFGNLVLNPSKRVEHAKVPPKKYPLSDFKPPYIPPSNRQELSYSITLDFYNGSTLQIACEDSVAQAQVLRRLSDSYKKWAHFER